MRLLEQYRTYRIYTATALASRSTARRQELLTIVPVDTINLDRKGFSTIISLFYLHDEYIMLFYTHIVLIPIGNKQRAATIVCKRSTRVICRSSRLDACLIVRMLRMVRKANELNTTNGNVEKITGT